MTTVCKNCKLYKGDCGHHFVDGNGHIDYYIPDEKARNLYGQCVFFEIKDKTIDDLLENIKKDNLGDEDKELIQNIIQSRCAPCENVDLYRPLVSVRIMVKKKDLTQYKLGILAGLQLAYLFFTDCLVTDDGYIFVGNGTKENVERFMESAKRYCHDVVFE